MRRSRAGCCAGAPRCTRWRSPTRRGAKRSTCLIRTTAWCCTSPAAAHHQFRTIESYEVEVRTLDAFALTDVTFIKVDVEGSERMPREHRLRVARPFRGG
jgi:hypothetical protein